MLLASLAHSVCASCTDNPNAPGLLGWVAGIAGALGVGSAAGGAAGAGAGASASPGAGAGAGAPLAPPSSAPPPGWERGDSGDLTRDLPDGTVELRSADGTRTTLRYPSGGTETTQTNPDGGRTVTTELGGRVDTTTYDDHGNVVAHSNQGQYPSAPPPPPPPPAPASAPAQPDDSFAEGASGDPLGRGWH